MPSGLFNCLELIRVESGWCACFTVRFNPQLSSSRVDKNLSYDAGVKYKVIFLGLGILLSSCAPTSTLRKGGGTDNMLEYAQAMAKTFDSQIRPPTKYCEETALLIKMTAGQKDIEYVGTFEFDSSKDSGGTIIQISVYAIPLAPYDGKSLISWQKYENEGVTYRSAEWLFEKTTRGMPLVKYVVIQPEGRNAVVCMTTMLEH
jgi:hypothetical protein